MKIFAIIKAGVIINVAVWDGVTPWTPPEETQVLEITQADKEKTIGIDDLYDGSKFEKAPPKVDPEEPKDEEVVDGEVVTP